MGKFIEIHEGNKSVIVNTLHIVAIEDGTVHLFGGQYFTCSESHEELMALLQ